MRHVLAKHESAIMDAATCSCFAGIGKGICLSCGTLRAASGSFCGRCRTSIGTRPPIIGDVVRAPRCERNLVVPESSPDSPAVWAPMLPLDFDTRLRALSANTLTHIPVAFRERVARIMTKRNNNIIAGATDGNLIAKAWPKLLLSVPPGGFSMQGELSKRFALWRESDLSQLLNRIEEQRRAKAEKRKLQRSVKSMGSSRRARILTQEGVLSKAAKCLTSAPADLSTEDQKAWAEKLLPCSVDAQRALNVVAPALVDDGEEANLQRRVPVMKGIRFSALSAPGPSGARPEHLKEALHVPRRQIATSLLSSLSLVVEAAINGTLPDAAKWILESRLVYLQKKNSSVPRPIRIGELLRRVIGKQLKTDIQSSVTKTFLESRQFGAGVPGSADVLRAFRLLIENEFRE